MTTYYVALLTHAQYRVSWTAPSPIAPYFDVDPALLWEEVEIRPPDNDNADYKPSATHLTIPGSAAVDVIDVFGYFTDPASDPRCCRHVKGIVSHAASPAILHGLALVGVEIGGVIMFERTGTGNKLAVRVVKAGS